MASQTTFEYYDDLTGKPINIDDLHTIEWSWLGVDYVVDVDTTSVEKIEAGKVSVATLLDKSTRVGGRKRSTAPKRLTPATGDHTNDQGQSLDLAEVRRWAQEQGYDIAARGRIPQGIKDAYLAQ